MSTSTVDILVMLNVIGLIVTRGFLTSTEAACLKVLAIILPSSVLADVLVSHYKLVLGSPGQSSAQGDRWERFEMWLLACLGVVPPSIGKMESKVSETCLVLYVPRRSYSSIKFQGIGDETRNHSIISLCRIDVFNVCVCVCLCVCVLCMTCCPLVVHCT